MSEFRIKSNSSNGPFTRKPSHRGYWHTELLAFLLKKWSKQLKEAQNGCWLIIPVIKCTTQLFSCQAWQVFNFPDVLHFNYEKEKVSGSGRYELCPLVSTLLYWAVNSLSGVPQSVCLHWGWSPQLQLARLSVSVLLGYVPSSLSQILSVPRPPWASADVCAPWCLSYQEGQ